MFSSATTNNWNIGFTTGKRYLIWLFIGNLLTTILKNRIKNIQLTLSLSCHYHSKNYCWSPQFMITDFISVVVIIEMTISNYIPHNICIHYHPISYPLNPTILFLCMFIDHLNEHFHPPQCILCNIISLIFHKCLTWWWVNNQNWGILSSFFPIKSLSIRWFHIIFGNYNDGGSICSCLPWYPTFQTLSPNFYYLFLI